MRLELQREVGACRMSATPSQRAQRAVHVHYAALLMRVVLLQHVRPVNRANLAGWLVSHRGCICASMCMLGLRYAWHSCDTTDAWLLQKLKNDLREEMHTKARLAAMEAARTSAQPTVIVNQAGSSGSAPAAPTVIYHKEKYCGPLSWVIGCFLFPCIACCPIDQREVPVVATRL